MECDPWDWQDGLKLDGAYPLEMIKCFWDEMPLGEDVSKSLLSTPVADILHHDQPLFSIRDQDPQHSYSTPGLSDNVFHGAFQAGSPRIKRRRLLFREADPSFVSREESTHGLEHFTECVPDIHGSVEHQALAPDAFWHRACDDSTNSFGDVLDWGSTRWMTKCVEDADLSNTMRDEMKIALPAPGSSTSGALLLPACEEDLQGPGTPLPGRSTHVSKPIEHRNHHQQSSPPSTPFASSSKGGPDAAAPPPVAYPFSLVKPEGGLTLREINEKLMVPPSSRPLPHHGQADDSWPTSPSELGLGLSGKSVITRTRIHTMGNGTITIMRTRD